jgi:hypothetical protein
MSLFNGHVLPKLRAERVVVHTRDGQSFDGVLLATHKDVLALTHASLLHEGGRHSLDGDVLVPLENVAFIQAGMS